MIGQMISLYELSYMNMRVVTEKWRFKVTQYFEWIVKNTIQPALPVVYLRYFISY